jgi:hypothetical protein
MRKAAGDAEYDYTDSSEVELSPGDDRSPEALARAAFEGASWPMRWFLLIGWRAGLGLRLGPRDSPEHILGWAIAETSPDSIALELRSWLLSSRLVFQVDATHASASTLVRYETPLAAILWPPVSILHRLILPWRLRRAVASGATG